MRSVSPRRKITCLSRNQLTDVVHRIVEEDPARAAFRIPDYLSTFDFCREIRRQEGQNGRRDPQGVDVDPLEVDRTTAETLVSL